MSTTMKVENGTTLIGGLFNDTNWLKLVSPFDNPLFRSLFILLYIAVFAICVIGKRKFTERNDATFLPLFRTYTLLSTSVVSSLYLSIGYRPYLFSPHPLPLCLYLSRSQSLPLSCSILSICCTRLLLLYLLF